MWAVRLGVGSVLLACAALAAILLGNSFDELAPLSARVSSRLESSVMAPETMLEAKPALIAEPASPSDAAFPKANGSDITLAARQEETSIDNRDLIELGRYLFTSPLLSSTGTVSCATCHDPKKSFTDGLVESKGILGNGVGRNTPTLVALSHVKGYLDPRASSRGRALSTSPGIRVASTLQQLAPEKPTALSLEERCLLPIQNPLEMGDSIDEVVETLRQTPTIGASFDQVFLIPYEGVTKARLGKALGAYVRSLAPSRSPYHDYLNGNKAALTATEKDGLEILKGSGRCTACHSGPGLTDGLLHQVSSRGRRLSASQRSKARKARERRRAISRKLREPLGIANGIAQNESAIQSRLGKRLAELLPSLSTGRFYEAAQVQVQTTTLWDVARTGPYFRDGSVASLKDAVRQHIRELRQLSGNLARRGRRQRSRFQVPIPKSLKPAFSPGAETATPSELGAVDVDCLVVFLKALSPIGGVPD